MYIGERVYARTDPVCNKRPGHSGGNVETFEIDIYQMTAYYIVKYTLYIEIFKHKFSGGATCQTQTRANPETGF